MPFDNYKYLHLSKLKAKLTEVLTKPAPMVPEKVSFSNLGWSGSSAPSEIIKFTPTKKLETQAQPQIT